MVAGARGVIGGAPSVARAHGLGAVKEMYLEPFARRFAETGIVGLVLDYCGFGGSGGEPRQRFRFQLFDVQRNHSYASDSNY